MGSVRPDPRTTCFEPAATSCVWFKIADPFLAWVCFQFPEGLWFGLGWAGLGRETWNNLKWVPTSFSFPLSVKFLKENKNCIPALHVTCSAVKCWKGGVLQAATYKKGANMKCMLFVSGALFWLMTKIDNSKPTSNQSPPSSLAWLKNQNKNPKAKPASGTFFPFCGANLVLVSFFPF